MIPVFDLKRQNKTLEKELAEAIFTTISKGIYILGQKVSELEEAFAKYLGVKYAIGVASGTDALSLSLLALGVGNNDEVIVPANAYPTVFAVTAIGAIPKLVDIDPLTFNLDPEKIAQAINKKTKAIIAVHLYGLPADLISLKEKIRQTGRKIYLIEDCAQAHGAEIKLKEGEWVKVGSKGEVGCFSFYPTKNLGCFGDGGMVATNNEEIYQRLKLLRMYGEKTRYQSLILGRNSRLDELQAAILLLKLPYLTKWNKKRGEVALFYRQNCQNKRISLPMETNFAKHVYHLFVVRCQKRDKLRKFLEGNGVKTAIHYPTPIHLQPAFKFLKVGKGDFPQTERASTEILSLPMFPELTLAELEKITALLNKFPG